MSEPNRETPAVPYTVTKNDIPPPLLIKALTGLSVEELGKAIKTGVIPLKAK